MRRTAHLSLRLLLSALVAGLIATTAPQAQAGGSWMRTVRESYSVGETATLVGYVRARHVKPRDAFIPAEPSGSDSAADTEMLPIGQIKFTRTAHSGNLRLRAFLQFVVPETLSPGPYIIHYDTAEGFVGDLAGGVIYVDMNPPSRIRREWALDEPEIENLPNRAIIQLPGKWITAQNLREGGIELAVPNGSRRATTATTTTAAQAPVTTEGTTSTSSPNRTDSDDVDVAAPAPPVTSEADEDSTAAAAGSDGSGGLGAFAPVAVLALVLAVTLLLRRRRFWLQQAAVEQATPIEDRAAHAVRRDGADDQPLAASAPDPTRIEIHISDFDTQLSDRYG